MGRSGRRSELRCLRRVLIKWAGALPPSASADAVQRVGVAVDADDARGGPDGRDTDDVAAGVERILNRSW